MATIVCSRCSSVISINGKPPRLCPSCGGTLGIDADSTRTVTAVNRRTPRSGWTKPDGAADNSPLDRTVIDSDIKPDRETIGRYQVQADLGSGGFGIGHDHAGFLDF